MTASSFENLIIMVIDQIRAKLSELIEQEPEWLSYLHEFMHDWVTTPFDPEVLFARMGLLIKRVREQAKN